MSLNLFLLRTAFGSQPTPDLYEFVLMSRGRMVDGYQRPRVARGAWKLRDATVTAPVRFGPAGTPLVFDAVQVRAGDVVVDEFDVGVNTLAPGVAFDFEAVFELPAVQDIG